MTARQTDRAAQRWRSDLVCRASETCGGCFDLLGRSREVLAHTVLEDDRLVLIRHTAVHHRAVPVALHVRLVPLYTTLVPQPLLAPLSTS